MRVIIAGAIIGWIASIAYVPLSVILQLEGWAPLQRCTIAAAAVLTLIAGRTIEYKIGYRRGWLDRDESPTPHHHG